MQYMVVILWRRDNPGSTPLAAMVGHTETERQLGLTESLGIQQGRVARRDLTSGLPRIGV